MDPGMGTRERGGGETELGLEPPNLNMNENAQMKPAKSCMLIEKNKIML